MRRQSGGRAAKIVLAAGVLGGAGKTLAFAPCSPPRGGRSLVAPVGRAGIARHDGRRRNLGLWTSNEDGTEADVAESPEAAVPRRRPPTPEQEIGHLDGAAPGPPPMPEEEPAAPVLAEGAYSTAIRNFLLSLGAAGLFGAGLWIAAGPQTGQEFFAGFLVEKSLSVDNLFVFLLLFDFFKVPPAYQNRILTYGIYGAIVLRALMIGLGAAALRNFRGILLAFAGILIYSAAQVLFDVEDDDEEDMNDNPVVWLATNVFPSTDEYDGDRFFTIEDGAKKATPLFICMIAVELSDVVFAVDSIPAVFGVTENPLVVFTSNVFAILGLRSLYTVLSKAASELKYLEPAVAVVLAFIGCKMIAEYSGYAVPTPAALAVIVSLLGVGVGASVLERRAQGMRQGEGGEKEGPS